MAGKVKETAASPLWLARFRGKRLELRPNWPLAWAPVSRCLRARPEKKVSDLSDL
jgi:hypothetical protein